MGQLLHEEETFAIRGAVFETYREMGSGFLEPVIPQSPVVVLKSR
jgi:hypothetical protein